MSDDPHDTPAAGRLPELPRLLFLPVFEPGNPYLTLGEMQDEFGVRAIIVNAYFLYRQKELRRALPERGIKDHLGFDGLVMTDSGAFQAFRTRLHLRNRTIIKFQDDIGSDIVSPLDVITPPGDNTTTAEGKLRVTMQRIEEGLGIVRRGTLAGVQQGGRFDKLRHRSAEELGALSVEYVALGSLVPFFNRNHHLGFVGRVIRDARAVLPEGTPLHLYGAGDPLELPFYAALGCTVFDSSSYVHYAERGSYMTPYGSIAADASAGWADCACPYCERHGVRTVRGDTVLLCRHNLWTLLDVVGDVRGRLADGTLSGYLDQVVTGHEARFPESLLPESWAALGEGG